ncbi:hypothetical protein F4680DRAFT_278659 [Xylaria scruposa]|nr:hypothetical protein F4680DRAFT_278659 [Xylaria scruposa]
MLTEKDGRSIGSHSATSATGQTMNQSRSQSQAGVKSLDVIAAAAMQPPKPQWAKDGPREYMMSLVDPQFANSYKSQ